MPSTAADFVRLSTTVQRLLDAELLLDAHGAALRADADAACRFSRSGDTAAARRHVERVALVVDALVRTQAIAVADGRAVMEVTNTILHADSERGA